MIRKNEISKVKDVDNPSQPPRILSLCSGYCGLEKGISRAIGKCTVLAHVEIEAFAITNLVNKMETGQMDPVPIWTDLKTFDARPFRDCVDILTGGYPCQPFSAAGKRTGKADPRHLWPFIETIIFHCRPKQIFLENVEGHLTLGVSEVLEDLEAMGYRVEVGIFSAVEVGAPHQRKRVFILADHNNRRSDSRGKSTGQQERANTCRSCESSELADSGLLRSEVFKKQATRTFKYCKELGNSKGDNKRRVSDKELGARITTGRSSSIFPNPNNVRSELPRAQHKTELSNKNDEKWPARPGAPQFKWEQPRVLADSGGEKRQRIPQPERWYEDKKTGESGWAWSPKPKLGRTIDGAGHRVDRLRLLGNGVVWRTAMKAYIVLSEKLSKDK